MKRIQHDPSFSSRSRVARCLAAVALALAGAAASASVALATASFQGLGNLPDLSGIEAGGLSADGSVVLGGARRLSDSRERTLLWEETSGWVDLGVPPGADYVDAHVTGRGISGDGSVVVGHTFSFASRTSEAFRWDAASGFVSLGFLPGASSSSATSTNADGSVIVGTDSGGWRWDAASGMVSLGSLPGGISGSPEDISADGSVIVGTVGGASGGPSEAFRWDAVGGALTLGFLPGFVGATARVRVSADGLVVTGDQFSPAPPHFDIFRWDAESGIVSINGDFEEIIDRGIWAVTAWAVSADGSVIVGSAYLVDEEGGLEPVAFIWDAVHGVRNLAEVLVSEYGVDLTGWSLREATGISADGRTIVGVGRGPAGPESWMVTLLEPFAEEIEQITDLQEIVEEMDLPRGMATSLNAKLAGARDALEAGDVEGACNVLRGFLKQVRAQSGRRLTEEQAAELIAEAEEIRSALGCDSEGPA